MPFPFSSDKPNPRLDITFPRPHLPVGQEGLYRRVFEEDTSTSGKRWQLALETRKELGELLAESELEEPVYNLEIEPSNDYQVAELVFYPDFNIRLVSFDWSIMDSTGNSTSVKFGFRNEMSFSQSILLRLEAVTEFDRMTELTFEMPFLTL